MNRKDLFCAKLSEIAYGRSNNNAKDRILGKTEYCKDEVQLFFGFDKLNNFYIVFRGSDETKDWLKNLKFLTKKVDGYKFHKGQLESWQKVENFIVDILVQRKSFIYNIYITGHSLGGSLAEIAGFFIAKKLPIVKEKLKVYSYGANRVFNWKAKRWFDKNVFCRRFVNNGDIVPKVPLKLLEKIGLLHPKKKIQIGKKEKWWHNLFPWKIKKDIESHSIEEYIKNLN